MLTEPGGSTGSRVGSEGVRGRAATPSVDDALDALERRLTGSIASFGLRATVLGDPESLAGAVSEIRDATRGHRIGQPSTETSTETALRFLRGEPVDAVDLDRLAWALCTPIAAAGHAHVVAAGTPFEELLRRYRRAAGQGTLWRVTWLGLLSSYFAFDPEAADAPSRAGWQALRVLLQATWPGLRFPPGYEPDWAGAVREHPELLSPDPCGAFAEDYLAGERARVDRLERDLGIPRTSWFWRELLLAAVDRAIGLDDAAFKRVLDPLIEPMRSRRAGRDEAIGRLLERYALCRDRSVHRGLRDFVVDPDVWKNPKLMLTGAAPVWSALSHEAWRMAMGWVSEANMGVFFRVLVEQDQADEGRLEFWSRYAGQIARTRLAVGGRTIERSRRNQPLARLLALQDGDAAPLTGGWQAVDAIMIEAGDYLFVESSVKGSTCYAYPRDNLPFDPDARTLSGGTADLKAGYYHRGEPRDLRIPRGPDWQPRMAHALARIGIHPDRVPGRADAQPVVPPPARRPAAAMG